MLNVLNKFSHRESIQLRISPKHKISHHAPKSQSCFGASDVPVTIAWGWLEAFL